MTIQQLKQLLSEKFRSNADDLRKLYYLCNLLDEPIMHDEALALDLLKNKLPLSQAMHLLDEISKQVTNQLPDHTAPDAMQRLKLLFDGLNLLEQEAQLRRLWKKHVARIDLDYKLNSSKYPKGPKYNDIMFKP